MLTTQSHITLRLGFASVLVALISGCADPSRTNPLDPVNAPVIEMSDPVLDNGVVLIRWRYVTEGDRAAAFLIRKVASAQGDRFPRSSLLGAEELEITSLSDVGQSIRQVGTSVIASG